MAQHTHKFTIGDDSAVHALLNKLTKEGGKQSGRAKLLRALDEAARHYEDSNQKVRQAVFHGLLTGYAVALKVR
jgi:molybdenum-dependent DNA-binding transcriptional regulator ModE